LFVAFFGFLVFSFGFAAFRLSHTLELFRILGTIPKAASGFVYIANAVKEFGAVKYDSKRR
jgi:hypothetical protein